MRLDLTKITPLESEPYPYTELQLKWLNDLETTDAPQGRGRLELGGGFCCLGRACVVAGLTRSEWRRPDGEVVGIYWGESTLLPDSLAMDLMLNSISGDFVKTIHPVDDPTYPLSSLTDLNDDAELSFKDIAAYIRHDPWNVFRDPNEVTIAPEESSN